MPTRGAPAISKKKSRPVAHDGVEEAVESGGEDEFGRDGDIEGAVAT